MFFFLAYFTLYNSCCLVTKSCPTLLWPHRLQPTSLLCPWDFSGKNTGMGSHSLLQGIFLTQGLNIRLLHCRWILLLNPYYRWEIWSFKVTKLVQGNKVSSNSNCCLKGLFLSTIPSLRTAVLLLWEHLICISNEVDETGAYYTEWSKPERKTPIQYTNAYIWNLERW